MKRAPCAAVALTVALAMAGSASAQLGGSRFSTVLIRLRAIPQSVPADGRTPITIRADVRDLSNNPVADGTEVVFYTNLGDLSLDGVERDKTLRALTGGGITTVQVISDEPGQATISAQVEIDRNTTNVEFTPEGLAGEEGSPVVYVTGKWVGYSIETALVEALGGELKYKGLVIQADQLWVDTDRLIVKADLPRLKRGDKQFVGETLYYDLAGWRGIVRRFDETGRLERVYFSGYTLEPTDAPSWQAPSNAFEQPKKEPDTWMVAKAVSIFPREKVVLRGATLYVQEQRIARLPGIFVLGKEGYRGSASNQIIDISSTGGIGLDFPYFLQVNEHHSTAMHLQKGRPSGRIGLPGGWGVGVGHEYAYDTFSGEFMIDSLPRDDFGLSLEHQHQLAPNTDSALSLAWPGHRSLFTNASVIQGLGHGRMHYRLATDKLQGRDWTVNTSAGYLANPKPIGRTGLNYRPGTRVMYRKYDSYWNTEAPFAHETSVDLSMRPWKPTKTTSVRPRSAYSFTWDSDGEVEQYYRFGVSLDQRLGSGRQVSLGYSLSERFGDTYFGGLRQRVDATYTSFAGRKWRTLLNASYDLTRGNVMALGSVDYRWHRWWHTEVFGRYYSFSSGDFADVEVSVGRAIGSREIALVWSAQQDRFAVELGSGFY